MARTPRASSGRKCAASRSPASGTARDYGRRIGLKGHFLIEPRPMEPMRHQYDFDSATVIGFLRRQGLRQGKPGLATLVEHARQPGQTGGRQEAYENLFNPYLLRS